MDDATKAQDVNQAAPPSEPACETCKGVGMIGGFVNADSGYDGMPCPECSPKGDPSGALRGEPEAAGHGSVEGDVRALRQMVADCDVYLKEGETPAQRIERERRDTEAVLNLLIREKQRTEAMREVIGTLRDLLDMWHGGHLQVRPEAEGAWLAAVQVGETAIARSGQAASGCSHTARSDRTRSQKLADAGFTRRPSLWAMRAREILELIAAPKRADGTWNRDREACRQLAAEALGRDEGLDEQNGGEQGATPPAPAAPLGDGEQLWLWQNGDHFFAFRHLYPCFSPGGDPMTLGEPFGRAIFKHSHNRQGRPNEQQRTDRQSPRSSPDPDLQRRHAASAGQACSAGTGASLGHSQHPIAPQVGWGAGDDGARSQSAPDIAGAAGVLAAAGNVAEGVAALAASPQPAAPVEDTVQIPRSALRWLFGEEGEFECPPRLYFRGKPPGYWWRAVFREKIAAPAEGGAS